MTIANWTESAALTDRVPRPGLREQVTSRILTAVFERRFVSGQRLIVQKLAELYGVSPTPVRESLVELAGLGIVELLPNRGAVVNPFGSEQIRQLSQVRRVLEIEAARSACGNIDTAVLRSLRDELIRLQKVKQDDAWDRLARAIDSRLHPLIADSSGNPRLAHEIKRYLSLFRTLRNVSHPRDSCNNYQRSNDVPEHLAIVDSLMAGNPDQAAQAVDRHLRSITDVLSEVIYPNSPAASFNKEKRKHA